MLKNRLRLRGKLIFSYLCVVLISSAVLGGILFAQGSARSRRDLESRLLAIVKTAAVQIDADQHSLLTSHEMESSPFYIETRHSLQRIRRANPDLAFLYTLARRPDGQIYFVVDEAVDEDRAKLGDSYDSNPSIEAAFSGKPTIASELVTDSWGTFLSGYAPIHDSASRVVGLVAGDIRVDDILAAQRSQIVSTLVVAGISVLVALGIGIWVSSWISAPLVNMVLLLRDIAEGEGDLTGRLRASSQDELGDLARWFNVFVDKIHNLVRSIAAAAADMATASDEFAAAGTQVGSATQQTATTIAEVARGAQEQSVNAGKSAESLTQIAESMEAVARDAQSQEASPESADTVARDMVSSLEAVANGLREAVAVARENEDSASRGIKTIEKVIDSVAHLRKTTAGVVQGISDLGACASNIRIVVQENAAA